MEFLFLFSHGSYSDYSPTDLYICDHKVTDEEWVAHKNQIEEFRKGHEELAMKAYCDRTGILPIRVETMRHGKPPHVYVRPPEGWYGCPEREEFLNRNDILAKETFVAKHNMLKVEYEEFWEDA